jgi:hypothetical protein
MNIDETAPVAVRDQIEVNADPDTVWGVISGIEHWPEWNPAVTSVALEGPVGPGTTFRWKAGGTITSTLEVVDPPREIGWTGKMLGIKAVHVYRLEPQGGRTVVHTAESWDGPLPRSLPRVLHKRLQRSLAAGLQALKAAAEQRATAPAEKRRSGPDTAL